jgi:hypothetical protein
MLKSFLIGAGIIAGLMILWVMVQTYWGKSFADYIDDEDVLAARGGCGNCGCMNACKNKTAKSYKNQ